MTTKLRIIFFLQAVIAFVIIFLLNYYALNLSAVWSALGGLAFILIVGIWASFRLNKYREKLRKEAERKRADYKKEW